MSTVLLALTQRWAGARYVDLDERPLDDEDVAHPGPLIIDHVPRDAHDGLASQLSARDAPTWLGTHGPLGWADENHALIDEGLPAGRLVERALGPLMERASTPEREALFGFAAPLADNALALSILAAQVRQMGPAAAQAAGLLAWRDASFPVAGKPRHKSLAVLVEHGRKSLDDDAGRALAILRAAGVVDERDTAALFALTGGATPLSLLLAEGVVHRTQGVLRPAGLFCLTPPPDDDTRELGRTLFLDRASAEHQRWQRRGESDAARWLLHQRDALTAIIRGKTTPEPERVRAFVALEPLFLSRPSAAERLAQGLSENAAVRRVRGEAAFRRGDGTAARALLFDDDAPPGAALHLARGIFLHAAGEFTAAMTAYESADEAADDMPAIRGRALQNLGAVFHDFGEFDEAEARYLRALAVLADADAGRLLGITTANLARLLHERAQFDRAREKYQTALDHLERSEDRRLWAITRGNAAAVEFEAGDPAAALTAMEDAAVAIADSEDGFSLAVAQLRLAPMLATAGRVDDADLALAKAAEHFSRHDLPLWMRTLGLARALCSLIAASGPSGAGAAEAAQQLLHAAGEGAPSLLEQNDEARVLARLLAERLGAPQKAQGLAVAVDGTWLQGADGVRRDIEARENLRRVLAFFATQQSGDRARWTDVFEAGWPGEKASAAAARNRVYVALSTLRKLGLGDGLDKAKEGYRLADDVQVVDSTGV